MISYDVAQFSAPLQRFERPTPRPQGSEVLVRTLAAGVCHSDLHLWEGGYDLGSAGRLSVADRGVKLPFTMGHEISGEVVELGRKQAASRLARSISCSHGSVAMIARCAGQVTSSSACSRVFSEFSGRAGMATTCWCRIRAI
jgi:D-arabinose 1-dehydrogenase-like Zn-dependent alcohol dehydrogenase